MFFLVHKFCDISFFPGGGEGGGGGRGHSDQPPARRGGAGLGALPYWLSLLTLRKPLAPGGPGPRVGQSCPQGRLSPPPPGQAQSRTRGRIVPTEVPGLGNTSGHCVCSPGCGLRRPSLLASGAGLGGRSPALPWASASGRDGRQRTQTAACS